MEAAARKTQSNTGDDLQLLDIPSFCEKREMSASGQRAGGFGSESCRA